MRFSRPLKPGVVSWASAKDKAARMSMGGRIYPR
jgi:hypothetical protein